MKKTIKTFVAMATIAALTIAVSTPSYAASRTNSRQPSGFTGETTGAMPRMNNGMAGMNSERPTFNSEMPDMNGEMPEFNGEMPEFNGEMPDMNDEKPMINLRRLEEIIETLEDETLKSELTALLETLRNALDEGLNLDRENASDFSDKAPSEEENSTIKDAEEALLEAIKKAGIDLTESLPEIPGDLPESKRPVFNQGAMTEDLSENERPVFSQGTMTEDLSESEKTTLTQGKMPEISKKATDQPLEQPSEQTEKSPNFFERIGNFFKSLF